MVYTVSAGCTLSKIALKFNAPLSTILNLNQIQHPDQLFINQIIQIPNMHDIPEDASFSLPTPASMLINRAKSVINSLIAYKLASGGMLRKIPFLPGMAYVIAVASSVG